jgi:hypothetical protein
MEDEQEWIEILGMQWTKDDVKLDMIRKLSHLEIQSDWFIMLCKSAVEFNKEIREIAMQMLAKWPKEYKISNRILMQTLSKISIFKKTEQLKKGNIRLKVEFLDDEKIEDAFIENDYCGIFIHGLEDEFMSVREATLNAMEHFAMISECFAQNAVDFILDVAFNDFEELQIQAKLIIEKVVEKWGSKSILDERQLKMFLQLSLESNSDSKMQL